MDTLRDLLARDRRSDAVACRVGADGRAYDYDDFLTTAWQAGNYLRHLGVREAVVVGIATDPFPEALLAALGSGLLGATVWFDPPPGADLRAFVGPASANGRSAPAPGVKRVVYGASVDDPTVECFEEGVWSENPTIPPERPDSGAVVLTDGNGQYTQARLLAAAADIARDVPLEGDDDVVLRSSLADPRSVVGMLAVLHTGGTIVVPDGDGESGDVALGGGPEASAIALETIAL